VPGAEILDGFRKCLSGHEPNMSLNFAEYRVSNGLGDIQNGKDEEKYVSNMLGVCVGFVGTWVAQPSWTCPTLSGHVQRGCKARLCNLIFAKNTLTSLIE